MKKIIITLVVGAAIGAGAAMTFNAKPDSTAEAGRSSTVGVSNGTANQVMVYVAFGADSVVLPSAWSFATPTSNLTCQFMLDSTITQPLPLSGNYLNATMAFGAPVGCGATKAELNVNNPQWYDTLDVSLVDGYSNKIAIDVLDRGTKVILGPPNGKMGNEKVFGLFPYGCDCCTKRQSPPCGIHPGGPGCKSGSQYHPDVPCQWQGSVMGGGSRVKVSLIGV